LVAARKTALHAERKLIAPILCKAPTAPWSKIAARIGAPARLYTMKRCLRILLLTGLSVSGCMPAYVRAKNNPKPKKVESVREADKRREKANKKYAKAQKKAERRMLKTEQKNGGPYKPQSR
jgi:hypothetical protein